jgi:uncharacterized membrane protein YgaE (UPF0421/DUF939 family)
LIPEEVRKTLEARNRHRPIFRRKKRRSAKREVIRRKGRNKENGFRRPRNIIIVDRNFQEYV